MAENNDNVNAGGSSAPQQTSQPTQNQGGTGNGEGQWFVPEKFKTAEDMRNSYNDLEKKLGEMGNKLGEVEKYVDSASKLVNAVYSDPDIANTVKQKYGTAPNQPQNNNQGQGQPQNNQPSEADKKIAKMDYSMRVNALKEFDEKFGIKPEEADEVHRKIGAELSSMNINAETIPLESFGPSVEKGFRLAYSDRYDSAVKSQGAAGAMRNMQASMPTQGGSSNSTNADGSVQLSNDQKEWMAKLGKDDAKAQETLKKHPD